MEKDMEQIVVSTTHGNIQVYRFGDGPQAVLLLHGSCVVMKGCKHWAIKERPHEFVQMIHSKL